MFATDIRGKTAMSRLSKRRGKIGWHSISCICDDCLDADVYVTCFPHYLAGRLSLEGLKNESRNQKAVDLRSSVGPLPADYWKPSGQ